jgi:hypothetical protein
MLVIIKHIFLAHIVAIGSSLGQIGIDSPAHDELSGSLLEWAEGQDRDLWPLFGSTEDSVLVPRREKHAIAFAPIVFEICQAATIMASVGVFSGSGVLLST